MNCRRCVAIEMGNVLKETIQCGIIQYIFRMTEFLSNFNRMSGLSIEYTKLHIKMDYYYLSATFFLSTLHPIKHLYTFYSMARTCAFVCLIHRECREPYNLFGADIVIGNMTDYN